MILLFLYTTLSVLLFSNFATSAPTLSVSPQAISKSGDTVTIKWAGIESPSDLDWIGIYSPPDSAYEQFIGYLFLSADPDWRNGSGAVSIPLVNLRSEYQFRVFRWTESEVDPTRLDQDHNPLPGTEHLLAVSGIVRFKPGRGPEQVHLAFTEREDELRVMFVTHDGHDSYIKYGLKKDAMAQVVSTKVGRYEREDMCDAPANESIGWRDPGFIHDGVITGLRKGKRYYYEVGSDSGGWSITHSFLSRNEDSDKTIAFIFGDMGTATPYKTFLRTQEESVTTLKWIKRDIETIGNNPSFISHIGDLSYARGYAWLWDNFFTQIEPIASMVPYHVCIGNHEYNWPRQPWRPDWSQNIYKTDGGGECGVPYSHRFNMPGNSSEITGTKAPPTRNLYYSFNTGSVHFLYISTETNFLPGSRQYHFIKHDLESVDRDKYPFVVVQGHRPMYTTNSYKKKGGPLMERMVNHLEPLFVENKVNLVLWGHVHLYERFCPMKNYTCGGENNSLPVHVVIGMGGQDWQNPWDPRPDHPTDPVFPQPEQSMYRSGEFGYTRLVANKEKLKFSYVGNHDGKVHDELEILANSAQVIVSRNIVDDGGRTEAVGSVFSWFVRGINVLMLGTFIGYVLGYISHAKRKFAFGKKRSPLENEQV